MPDETLPMDSGQLVGFQDPPAVRLNLVENLEGRGQLLAWSRH